LQDPSIDGRIILRRICREWDEGVWTGLIWLRTGAVVATLVNVVMNLQVQ